MPPSRKRGSADARSDHIECHPEACGHHGVASVDHNRAPARDPRRLQGRSDLPGGAPNSTPTPVSPSQEIRSRRIKPGPRNVGLLVVASIGAGLEDHEIGPGEVALPASPPTPGAGPAGPEPGPERARQSVKQETMRGMETIRDPEGDCLGEHPRDEVRRDRDPALAASRRPSEPYLKSIPLWNSSPKNFLFLRETYVYSQSRTRLSIKNSIIRSRLRPA